MGLLTFRWRGGRASIRGGGRASGSGASALRGAGLRSWWLELRNEVMTAAAQLGRLSRRACHGVESWLAALSASRQGSGGAERWSSRELKGPLLNASRWTDG